MSVRKIRNQSIETRLYLLRSNILHTSPDHIWGSPGVFVYKDSPRLFNKLIQLSTHSRATFLVIGVTTRPSDARRDAPLSRHQTRHNERSSETEGICPLFTLLLFLKSGTCNAWYLPVSQGSILFPPIIGNLNIATISHLASL